MQRSTTRPFRRLELLLAVGAALLASCRQVNESLGLEREERRMPAEVRADWVTGWSLTDEDAAQDLMHEIDAMRANTVLLQVRSRGDAYYRSSFEPRGKSLRAAEGDPLRAALAARGSELQVHAWMNLCLVADATDDSADPRHLAVQHPDWLAVPKELAVELWSRPTGDPEIRASLRRYAQAHKNSVEGLFGDPAVPEFRAHLVRVVDELCLRYDLSGIHFDYVRYPDADWGYGRATLDRFRVEVDRELNDADRRDMGARAARDPLVYARRYPARFAQFRRDAVTSLVRELGAAARSHRRDMIISAAVLPDIADARDHHFQDWARWLEAGELDAAAPMIYTTDPLKFDEQLRAALSVRGRGRIWAGIGAWRLEPQETIARIEAARRLGAAGVALFSHQGLQDRKAIRALANGPFARRSASIEP